MLFHRILQGPMGHFVYCLLDELRVMLMYVPFSNEPQDFDLFHKPNGVKPSQHNHLNINGVP